jgi:hypothetical protein
LIQIGRRIQEKKICKNDVLIVIYGKYTDTAKDVIAELSITNEEKPYFLFFGRSNDNVKKPIRSFTSDKIYSWNWENLKNLLSEIDKLQIIKHFYSFLIYLFKYSLRPGLQA